MAVPAYAAATSTSCVIAYIFSSIIASSPFFGQCLFCRLIVVWLGSAQGVHLVLERPAVEAQRQPLVGLRVVGFRAVQFLKPRKLVAGAVLGAELVRERLVGDVHADAHTAQAHPDVSPADRHLLLDVEEALVVRPPLAPPPQALRASAEARDRLPRQLLVCPFRQLDCLVPVACPRVHGSIGGSPKPQQLRAGVEPPPVGTAPPALYLPVARVLPQRVPCHAQQPRRLAYGVLPRHAHFRFIACHFLFLLSLAFMFTFSRLEFATLLII